MYTNGFQVYPQDLFRHEEYHKVLDVISWKQRSMIYDFAACRFFKDSQKDSVDWQLIMHLFVTKDRYRFTLQFKVIVYFLPEIEYLWKLE